MGSVDPILSPPPTLHPKIRGQVPAPGSSEAGVLPETVQKAVAF